MYKASEGNQITTFIFLFYFFPSFEGDERIFKSFLVFGIIMV
jgi:hypothetical protein